MGDLEVQEEKLAEVWIKPEGEPYITFRIPQEFSNISAGRLTLEAY